MGYAITLQNVDSPVPQYSSSLSFLFTFRCTATDYTISSESAYLVLLVKSAARPRRSFRPKFWKGNEAKLANSSCFRGGPQVSELAATRGVVNAMVRMKMNEMNTIRQWCLPVFHTCSTVCLSTVFHRPLSSITLTTYNVQVSSNNHHERKTSTIKPIKFATSCKVNKKPPLHQRGCNVKKPWH